MLWNETLTRSISSCVASGFHELMILVPCLDRTSTAIKMEIKILRISCYWYYIHWHSLALLLFHFYLRNEWQYDVNCSAINSFSIDSLRNHHIVVEAEKKTECEKVPEATKKSMSVNPFPYNQKKGEPMSKMNWKIFENRDSSIYLWLNWFLYNITHRFSIDFDIFRRTQKRNVSIALVHRFDVMLSISISHSIKTGCTAEKKKKKRDREKG